MVDLHDVARVEVGDVVLNDKVFQLSVVFRAVGVEEQLGEVWFLVCQGGFAKNGVDWGVLVELARGKGFGARVSPNFDLIAEEAEVFRTGEHLFDVRRLGLFPKGKFVGGGAFRIGQVPFDDKVLVGEEGYAPAYPKGEAKKRPKIILTNGGWG